MYIRKSTRSYKGRTYTNYVLVESVQTPKGPRQKSVCSLGDLSPRLGLGRADARGWRTRGSSSHALGPVRKSETGRALSDKAEVRREGLNLVRRQAACDSRHRKLCGGMESFAPLLKPSFQVRV